jgi:lysophospholipase L1-like esterase
MRRLLSGMLCVAPLSLALIGFSGCGTSNRPTDGTDAGTSADAGQTGPTTFTNHAKSHASYVPNSEHPATTSQLIVMGDSISAGYGTSADNLSYAALLDSNADATWPSEMNSSLSAYYKIPVPVLNVSHAGDTTDNLAAQQAKLDAKAPFAGPQIVTITIGGNDLTGALYGGQDPNGAVLTNAIQNIKNLVTDLQDKTKFPGGTSIYLMTVYDPTDGKGQATGCFGGLSAPSFVTALDNWRTQYIKLGTDMGFSVVDALGHFHGHGFNNMDTSNRYYDAMDPSRWFYTDCIHPNDRGHDELRRLFFEAIDWSYVATP